MSFPADRPKLPSQVPSNPTYCCNHCNKQLDEKLVDKIKQDGVGADRFVLTTSELVGALDHKQCPARFSNGVQTEFKKVSELFDVDVKRSFEPQSDFMKKNFDDDLLAVLVKASDKDVELKNSVEDYLKRLSTALDYSSVGSSSPSSTSSSSSNQRSDLKLDAKYLTTPPTYNGVQQVRLVIKLDFGGVSDTKQDIIVNYGKLGGDTLVIYTITFSMKSSLLSSTNSTSTSSSNSVSVSPAAQKAEYLKVKLYNPCFSSTNLTLCFPPGIGFQHPETKLMYFADQKLQGIFHFTDQKQDNENILIRVASFDDTNFLIDCSNNLTTKSIAASNTAASSSDPITNFMNFINNNGIKGIAARPITTFVKSVGQGNGNGPQQLNDPLGICIVPVPNSQDHHLWISDCLNPRIQIWDMKGNHVCSVGKKGKSKAEFNGLRHQVYHDGMVFVAEYNNDRIQIFDVAKVYSIVAEYKSDFSSAVMAAIGKADCSNGSDDGEFDGPRGIAINPITNQLFVSEMSNDRIQVFSIAKTPSRLDFKFQYKFGSRGSSNGQFKDPLGMRIRYNKLNPSSNDDFELYVADQTNHRVQILNGKTGDWIKNIGINNQGNGNGELKWVKDVEIHGNEVYVLEYKNHRISVFNVDDGKFIRHVCNNGQGSNDNQLNQPYAFALFNNQLFVADAMNHKIKVFGPSTL